MASFANPISFINVNASFSANFDPVTFFNVIISQQLIGMMHVIQWQDPLQYIYNVSLEFPVVCI